MWPSLLKDRIVLFGGSTGVSFKSSSLKIVTSRNEIRFRGNLFQSFMDEGRKDLRKYALLLQVGIMKVSFWRVCCDRLLHFKGVSKLDK